MLALRQMWRVGRDPIRLAALARQIRESLAEHALAAPTNEPIIDRLVRTAPMQPVLDHEDDGAHDPPVIAPGDAVRERKIPPIRRIRRGQQKQISHGEASSPRL
jgi:hypothetical protein